MVFYLMTLVFLKGPADSTVINKQTQNNINNATRTSCNMCVFVRILPRLERMTNIKAADCRLKHNLYALETLMVDLAFRLQRYPPEEELPERGSRAGKRSLLHALYQHVTPKIRIN